jgi:hypothetical protein
MSTGFSQKVPGTLSYRWFGAPSVCSAWKDFYWSFLRASFAEIARCSLEGVAQQMAGQWFLHQDNTPSHI